MIFNFRFAPLDSVSPWGREPDLSLHWYGLTEGCYWIRAGETDLFRYRDEFLQKSGWTLHGCLPYTDYYVGRLWDDILTILPDVLTPVPDVLRPKIAASVKQVWRDGIEDWFVRQDHDSDEVWNVYGDATEWLRKRYVDSLYLRYGPRTWLWSDGTSIHFEWDNAEAVDSGIAVWQAQVGSWSIPVEDFLQEVRTFDRDFIGGMQARVDQVLAGWSRPEVVIDKESLVQQQANAATEMEKALAKVAEERSFDWKPVIEAVAFIEAELESSA